MWYVASFIALAIVIAVNHSNRKAARLEAARCEYEKNEYALGQALGLSGIRIACLLAAAAALWLPEPVTAQEPYCMPCQAARWKSIEDIMLARAQRLKSARVLLRDSQQRGDASLIQKAQAHLDNITRLWNEINATAQALGSPSYQSYLARNLADTEAAYDAAHADWKKKLEQFNRLRSALGDQRARIQADIEGTLKEEERQRWQLGFNSVFTALKAGALGAEQEVHYLGSLPNGPAEHAAKIQMLNRLIGAQRAAELGKAGYEAHEGHYWEAGAGIGQLTLEMLVPMSSRMFPVVVATAPVVTLGLDLAAVGLSHVEWRAAQARLEDARSTESKWQFEVAVLAARVDNLKHEREMAADVIERQRAFEQQLGKVGAELRQ